MLLRKCDRAAARRELRTWLKGKTSGGEATRGKIVETYDYTDETGVVLKQVVRFSPKGFSQRKPDGKGGWIGYVRGVRDVPYRLSEVLRAQTVFVVEGEKDVESLRARGLVATTNAGGAGKWPDNFGKYLAGKETIILPDNDPAGQDHVQKVARNLHGFATSVRLLELPGLAPKGDVTDWFRAGNTVEKLLELVSGCPLWKPPQEAAPSAQTQAADHLRTAFQIQPKPAMNESVAAAQTDLKRHIIDFNDRFYVVGDFGGKCHVCWEEIDPVTRNLTLGHQSFNEFSNRFMHERVEVGQRTDKNGTTTRIFMTQAMAWLMNKNRRQYKQVAFCPGEKLGPEIRNLWHGFDVNAMKGDCSLYLAHLKDNVCKGDAAKFDWLIKWMAYKVRHPGEQGHTAVVFKGKEGVGKNVAAECFAHLFGAHAVVVTQREQLAGRFNAHLRACCILIANEAFFAGDRQHQASLKSLITDRSMMIEAKGVDAVRARNRISIIIMSNEDWVVPAGPEARRFTVFDCGENHREDTEYFGAIQHQLDHGGYEALLYHLLNEVDLKNFDPRRILRTQALAEQQSQSLRGADAAWYECLHRGELPGAFAGRLLVGTRLLEWARLQRRRDWENITSEQLGRLLHSNPRGTSQAMDFKKDQKCDPSGARVRVFCIPPLKQARAVWDEKRFKVEWPDPDDEWVIIPVGNERNTADAGEVSPSGAEAVREPGP
jgi:hypothetical protein